MDKKTRIEQLLKEMEAQYPADEKFKRGIAPLIDKLYEVPDGEFDKMLELTRETYQRNYESKMNLNSAKKALEETVENIKKIGENYKKMVEGQSEINSKLRSIVEKLPEVADTMKNNYETLESVKDTLQKNNESLSQAQEKVAEIEEKLTEVSDYKGSEEPPEDDPKTLF